MGKEMEGWVKGGIIGAISSPISLMILDRLQFLPLNQAITTLINVSIFGLPLVVWATIFGGIIGTVLGKILED